MYTYIKMPLRDQSRKFNAVLVPLRADIKTQLSFLYLLLQVFFTT